MRSRIAGMNARLLVALTLLAAAACAHRSRVTPASPRRGVDLRAETPAPVQPPRLAPANVLAPSSVLAPAPAPAANVAPAGGDFALKVRPILEQRCRPCHFAGGQVYQQLPFDRAETALRLREKLFTRLKDETARQAIRDFLAARPDKPDKKL
jgi:hypothetical protein